MLRCTMLRFARVGGARRPRELAVPQRALRWGMPWDEPENLDCELAEVVDPDELSDFEKCKARDLAFKLRAFTEEAIASKVRTDPNLARKSPEMRQKLANLIAVLGTLDEHGLELDPENAGEVVQGLGESYSWASAFRFLRTMAKSPDMQFSDELCGSLIRNLYDEGCYHYVQELLRLAQERNGNVTVGVHVQNALISILATQRSSLPAAHGLLHRLRDTGEANAGSYDALSRGLVKLGDMDDALRVLKLCQLDGKPQDEVGYNPHDFWAWVLLEARRLRVASSTVKGRYFPLAHQCERARPSVRDMAIYAWAGDFWGALHVYGELLKGPRTVQLLNCAIAMYVRFEMAQIGLRQLLDADRHQVTHNDMTVHLISTARDCLRPKAHEDREGIPSRPSTAPSVAAKYAHRLISAAGPGS